MNEIEKKKYDQLIDSVSFALRSLSGLFETEGMHGLYDLSTPNLDELKDVVSRMKDGVDSIAKEFEELVAKDRDMDAANASINVINIKQGIVYAESLLLAVEKLDYDKCIEANNNIKDHDLPSTQW